MTNNQKEFKEIQQKMIDIESQLEIMSQHTEKMSRHINFVEQVYEKIKRPFFIICEYVSKSSRFITY
tara:strand:- start:191 stop:391 length:201 start_codon:yes stop_codon:yes gene_type:complete